MLVLVGIFDSQNIQSPILHKPSKVNMGQMMMMMTRKMILKLLQRKRPLVRNSNGQGCPNSPQIRSTVPLLIR